jgi:hypothetical protein
VNKQKQLLVKRQQWQQCSIERERTFLEEKSDDVYTAHIVYCCCYLIGSTVVAHYLHTTLVKLLAVWKQSVHRHTQPNRLLIPRPLCIREKEARSYGSMCVHSTSFFSSFFFFYIYIFLYIFLRAIESEFAGKKTKIQFSRLCRLHRSIPIAPVCIDVCIYVCVYSLRVYM